jgi:two-component system phosphate regulon sensor histidine kinase PhoR
MSERETTPESATASDRPLARLSAARWTLAAATFVLVALLIAGRLGAAEAALAGIVVALATLVAPTRRSVALPKRFGQARAIVGPQTLALLSGLPDPVLVLDRRGVVVAANDGARAALGEVRLGDPISFVLRVPEVLDAVKQAALSAEPQVVSYAERVPVERWIEAHLAVARVGKDGPEMIVMALRDLTQQRRSERMRADFVANASHELRTPLASLLGFVETLQGPARNDPAARDRFLEIMRGQANRMSRLIDDLLSLSRIELKAHLRPRELVELSAVVRTVADALAPLAQDRGVTLQLDLADAPVWVKGDRDELIRVVENLVENAIKYGRSGLKIDVAVTGGAGRDGARVSVRDYGPGISPEHLPRLTERFYRVDVADSRDKGGTGLGLALVKHILQRHGGRLTVESLPGEGATFVVALEQAEEPKRTIELERAV